MVFIVCLPFAASSALLIFPYAVNDARLVPEYGPIYASVAVGGTEM